MLGLFSENDNFRKHCGTLLIYYYNKYSGWDTYDSHDLDYR